VVIFVNSDGEAIVEDVQQGWHMQAWVELRNGTPVVTELRLRPANGTTLVDVHGEGGPRGEYPHESGRQVPSGTGISDALRVNWPGRIYEALAKSDQPVSDTFGMHGVDAEELLRPGRRGRGDQFYAVWAQLYVQECEVSPRSPYPGLAEQHPTFTAGTIQSFVSQARARGLLVGTVPGRSGGRLSKKAERLLAVMPRRETSGTKS
jgi:hypothetical protein